MLKEKSILHILGQFGPENHVIGGQGVVMRTIALEAVKHRADVKVIVDKYSPMAPRDIDRWQRDGLDVYQFPLLKSMPKSARLFGRTQRKYVIQKLSFSKIMRLGNPDIVHFHMHPDGLLRMALEFKRKLKSRVIVTTHGLDPKFNDYSHYSKVPYYPNWTESVECVDQWVPCGPVDEKGLLDWGISADKIVSIHNGVDVPDELPNPTADPHRRGPFRVTYIGRMIERKGIYDLAAAMGHVAETLRGERFTLTMVGDYSTSTYDRLKSLIPPTFRNIQMEMLGEMPNAEIRKVLKSSDLYCHPSKNPLEGLPLSILEAGAYGCPMVLSDHYAHLAVYQPGVHASYFKMGDKEDLTAALLDLIRNREKRMTLRENAYALVKEKFNITKMLKNYMQLYADLMHPQEGNI